ncbi:MAG: hypothetical protein ACUVSQ_05295 [Pseudanabaenaceae cyanobacterium]
MAETGDPAYTVLLVGRGDRLTDCGRLLTWLGCAWETAETLPRAIERIVALIPDLVLLDGEALTTAASYWPLLCQTLQHRHLPWLLLVPRETGLTPLCATLDLGQVDCLEWPLRDMEAIARISLSSFPEVSPELCCSPTLELCLVKIVLTPTGFGDCPLHHKDRGLGLGDRLETPSGHGSRPSISNQNGLR